MDERGGKSLLSSLCNQQYKSLTINIVNDRKISLNEMVNDKIRNISLFITACCSNEMRE